MMTALHTTRIGLTDTADGVNIRRATPTAPISAAKPNSRSTHAYLLMNLGLPVLRHALDPPAPYSPPLRSTQIQRDCENRRALRARAVPGQRPAAFASPVPSPSPLRFSVIIPP